MPEYRQNLATKEWVIMSPGRGVRPNDFDKQRQQRQEIPERSGECPFCPGNERFIVDPLLESPKGDGWQIRVVPNKFAALDRNLTPTRVQTGAFLSAKGFGIADVVIEHQKHNQSIATMSTEEVTNVLLAYRTRQREISRQENINLVTIFRNHGARAGTSLRHPHSQIIATPIVPPHVRYPFEQAMMYYDQNGACVYCRMVEEEIRQKERVLIETDSFVAFCPYAARSPFECRIYPKKHQPSFVLIDDDDTGELASVLRELMSRIYGGLHDPDYNYIIRSSPIGDEDARYLHWYMVIIPRVTTAAGFEMGSGIYINTMLPEDCAQFLREVK